MKRALNVVLLFVVFLVAGQAFAAVTFCPRGDCNFASPGGLSYPYGFVGKGDVQIPFGWNNAQLQNNAGGLTFSYSDSAVYQQQCQHPAGKKIVYHTFTRKRGVNASIEYDARQAKGQKQVTGFGLLSLQTLSDNTGADICSDIGESGWTAAGPLTVVEGSETPGSLSVSYGGNSAVIWTAPPPPALPVE